MTTEQMETKREGWRHASALYRSRHRDEAIAYQRAHRAATRERRCMTDRAWYQRNAEVARTTHRTWYLQNAAARRAYSRAWNVANPEARRHLNATWRARRSGNGGSHTLAEWLEKVALFGGRCAYCGRADQPLTRDHVSPLSRGGTNDIANIVPACKSCNSRKSARAAAEFLA